MGWEKVLAVLGKILKNDILSSLEKQAIIIPIALGEVHCELQR